MNLVIMIMQTALSVLSGQFGGATGKALNLADAMVDIVAKAKAAYEAETGQPMDVSKIKPYVPLE